MFGRYRGTGSGNVVIEGERNGRKERFTATARCTSRQPDNTFVPPLWASRKIGELTLTNPVGVDNNCAFPVLAENFIQIKDRHTA